MSMYIAQGGGWRCVPASPPESSASISNSFQVFCRLRRGADKREEQGMGIPLRRWLAGASKGAAHAQWFDTDRTPGVTTGSTANGSLERSGAMELPMGRDQS